jgi:hypothetical protein
MAPLLQAAGLRQKLLTTMTLVAGLSLAPALIRAPAYAVDNM